MVVAGGATFIPGATQTLAALTINDGGNASVAAGANKVLTASSLSIVGSGELDLADNDLVVSVGGTDPFASVQGWIISGYSGGLWNGPGINSSAAAGQFAVTHPTALGYARSADNTSVIVRYTAAVDADLSGVVDTVDFAALAGNFGGSAQPWGSGDFNYDGFVDTEDFNLLAANFGTSVPAASVGEASVLSRTDAVSSAPAPAVASPAGLFGTEPIALGGWKEDVLGTEIDGGSA